MSSVTEKDKPLDHLLRSPDEIAQVLDALARQHAGVMTDLEGQGVQFASRFLLADPGREFILVAAAASRDANAALLSRQRVPMVSGLGSWRVEFVGCEPRETMHEASLAIRLRYPQIVSAHLRRAQPRIELRSRAPLVCLADAAGIMPFEAQLVDISLGGIGVLLHASDITLEPGTILLGCRIEVPGSEPVIVDLEARYSEVVVLPDGTRARRSGFRFIDGPPQLKRLMQTLAAGAAQ